jgi:hypothetical protein
MGSSSSIITRYDVGQMTQAAQVAVARLWSLE